MPGAGQLQQRDQQPGDKCADDVAAGFTTLPHRLIDPHAQRFRKLECHVAQVTLPHLDEVADAQDCQHKAQSFCQNVNDLADNRGKARDQVEHFIESQSHQQICDENA